MRNRDTILLEEAYQNIVKEMAYTPKEGGRQLTGTYRPGMPKQTQMPSVEKITKSAKSEEELEARKVAASAKINENIKALESDPNDVKPAFDILNIMNNFIEEKEVRTGVKEKTPREEFLIGDEEVSYQEILKKLLKLTTTDKNDPSLIIPKKDPVTFQKTPGLTVDQYIYGPTAIGRGKKADMTPIEGRDAEHYYLYREILKALPDMEGQIRSRREKTEEAGSGVELFYFGFSHKVILNGTQIGIIEHRGLGRKNGIESAEMWFYPNNEGLKMEDTLGVKFRKDNKHGFYFIKGKELKDMIANNKGIDISETEIKPYRTTAYVPEGGVFESPLFLQGNKRRPRREDEPNVAPPPYDLNKHQPPELRGKTLAEVRMRIGHDEAEENFKELYPPDKYPNLYTGGRFSGKV